MFLLCLISVFVFVLYLSFGRSSLGFFFSGFSFFSLSAELASMWYMCGIVQKKKKKKQHYSQPSFSLYKSKVWDGFFRFFFSCSLFLSFSFLVLGYVTTSRSSSPFICNQGKLEWLFPLRPCSYVSFQA